MKKLIGLIGVGLLIASLAAPAHAGKAQKVTLYLHGGEASGEVDQANNFGAYNEMDTTKPDGDYPKSQNGLLWVGDPQLWNDCAGMVLLPVWTGAVSGTIKGDMKLTLHTVSGPARQLEIEIWPDIGAQTCASNDFGEGNYPEPAAMTRVDIPPGHAEVKVVLKKVNFKAQGSVLLQLTPVGPVGPRILYDGADFASSLQFSCSPAKGQKSCTP